MSATIAVSEEQEKVLGGVMKFKGYDKRTDALQYVFQIFASRFNALRNYDKNKKPAPKKAAKKAKKAKVE